MAARRKKTVEEEFDDQRNAPINGDEQEMLDALALKLRITLDFGGLVRSARLTEILVKMHERLVAYEDRLENLALISQANANSQEAAIASLIEGLKRTSERLAVAEKRIAHLAKENHE